MDLNLKREQKTLIARCELSQVALQEIRLWPGCETVLEVNVLAEPNGSFLLRVVNYGEASQRLADRAIRAIERMKRYDYMLS